MKVVIGVEMVYAHLQMKGVIRNVSWEKNVAEELPVVVCQILHVALMFVLPLALS